MKTQSSCDPHPYSVCHLISEAPLGKVVAFRDVEDTEPKKDVGVWVPTPLHASAPSTASQENIQSSPALLGGSDLRKGPSVGVGLREMYFSSVGIQDFFFFFWVLTEGPSRELLSPGVTSNESVSTLESSPVAGAIGEGQAWEPGSHLPRACEMASSVPPTPPPSRQYPALSLVSCQSALPREGRGG